ncbi:MAG: UDP-glucose 4-epimerase GalE [Candidatus Dojkabacteria bacterium]
MRKILVSGGAGYIGSHMVKSLLEHGYDVTVWDNFSNSSLKNLEKVQEITGKKIEVVDIDLRKVIKQNLLDIDTIVNFAALKSVGESVKDPLAYYENNVYGTVNLLNFAKANSINKFIFSSTSAVYGNAPTEVVNEETPTNPESPYGESKLMSEKVIRDTNKAFGINAVLLRYFNVAGNDDSGLIGDELKNPLNLIPRMIMAHLGYIDSKLQVFGDDYPTKDGTGVRDYIHVVDLVNAHIKAIEFLNNHKGVEVFNLGTGNGFSVLEIIKAFEEVTGEKLEYDMVPRRPGDVATTSTNTDKAAKFLDWKAEKDLKQMISSSWLWYTKHYKA